MTEQTALTDLVKVDVQLPALTVNFDAMKKALTDEVARYGDVVVTPETIGDAREKAKEINATRKMIDQVRKDRRREAMAPIEEWDGQMKSLTGICDEAREQITSQIERFDQERMEECERLLTDALSKAWDRLEVDSGQRRAVIADLVKLGNLTDKANLTKAAQQAVETRAQEDRSRQDKVRMRLLELENRSYRAGLAAPLTADHVYQWLEADDDTYEHQLQRILDAEVKREEQAAAARQREQQQEQARREAEEKARAEREQRQATEQASAPDTAKAPAGPGSEQATSPVETPAGATQEAPRPSAAPAGSGRHAVTVTCTFETAVPGSVTDQQIEAELRRKLEAAGITSLAGVRIQRAEEAA